jgi:hypothetical protein
LAGRRLGGSAVFVKGYGVRKRGQVLCVIALALIRRVVVHRTFACGKKKDKGEKGNEKARGPGKRLSPMFIVIHTAILLYMSLFQNAVGFGTGSKQAVIIDCLSQTILNLCYIPLCWRGI